MTCNILYFSQVFFTSSFARLKVPKMVGSGGVSIEKYPLKATLPESAREVSTFFILNKTHKHNQIHLGIHIITALQQAIPIVSFLPTP